MNRGHGRRAVVIVAAALAAAVAASPAAGSAQHTVASTAWAGCNAFLPDGSAGLGGLDGIQAAARGSARAEKVMDASDIEIPAGAVPKVPKRFSVVIPTYFHVINSGPTAADGNVPDSQIQAQMRVLNQNFAGTGFSFSLAGVDRTTNAEWYAMAHSRVEREAKDALHRGDDTALNLYTADIDESLGLLGWAYYPKDVRGRPTIDGVVLAAGSLPGGDIENYDQGKTATHEVGHWLGLAHTFQGGCSTTGDRVSDTPAQKSPTSGCPEGRDSCPKDPGLDPIHNYMDYSYDACYTEFTPGQATRMAQQWLYYRAD
jgi:hypothetical protein